jgi:hypothetical protein
MTAKRGLRPQCVRAALMDMPPAFRCPPLWPPPEKEASFMYLVAIAWVYVVLMMAIVEALSPQGTVLGAMFTFALYGLLPLGIVMYLLGTPLRRRARIAASSAPPPDAGGHAAGEPIPAERKEP